MTMENYQTGIEIEPTDGEFYSESGERSQLRDKAWNQIMVERIKLNRNDQGHQATITGPARLI